MREIGMLLWIVGIAVIAYAGLLFDPSVSVGIDGFDRVINLHRQNQQLMMFAVGALMLLIGIGLHVASIFTPSHEPEAGKAHPVGQERVAIGRFAYARQLGVSEDGTGYAFEGQHFFSIEDAIAVAESNRL